MTTRCIPLQSKNSAHFFASSIDFTGIPVCDFRLGFIRNEYAAAPTAQIDLLGGSRIYNTANAVGFGKRTV